MKTIHPITKRAIRFLSERNVLADMGVSQSTYVLMLMDYIANKGEDALQALAGFYVWSIDHHEDDEDKRSRLIRSTFAHDLGEQKDKWMSPRSASYLKFWQQEMVNLNVVS